MGGDEFFIWEFTMQLVKHSDLSDNVNISPGEGILGR